MVPESSGRSTFIPFLENVDADLVESVRAKGCLHCRKGKLHRADYGRKPRGVACWPKDPEKTKRFSLCCDQEGCRKRHTPPSVRFMGRRVYGGVVAVLIPAMMQGLRPERVGQIRQTLELKIDRRTLERWRQWWLERFVRSSFWKEARTRFVPALCQQSLPLSLCLSFAIDERRDRLLELLKFLCPITTPAAWLALAG